MSNQTYWTIFNKPKLQKWINKIPFTKQNVLNVKNQIYYTKSIQSNLQNEINPTNTIELNLQKIKVKSNPSLSWAWPSSATACLLYFHCWISILWSLWVKINIHKGVKAIKISLNALEMLLSLSISDSSASFYAINVGSNKLLAWAVVVPVGQHPGGHKNLG